MFSLITIDVSTSQPKRLGRKEYQSIPRMGEWIAITDENGIEQIYEVVQVAHSAIGDGSDIYIRHLSETPQAILGLCIQPSE